MNTQKNTHIQSIHYCHFSLGSQKSNKILVHIFFHMKKKLLKVLQKAHEKVFHQLSLADLSSIYSLIIFLKHIFDHITILLRNQQELFMAWEVNPKTSLKESSACNSLQLPSPSVLHCFSFFNLLSKQNRQPAIPEQTWNFQSLEPLILLGCNAILCIYIALCHI